MSHIDVSPEDVLKEAIKTKDGDQLFKPDENFKALMGDDEDTVAFVFQHVSSDDCTLTSVARTTRGILSFGAVVKGEIDHHEQKEGVERSPSATRKPVCCLKFRSRNFLYAVDFLVQTLETFPCR